MMGWQRYKHQHRVGNPMFFVLQGEDKVQALVNENEQSALSYCSGTRQHNAM